MIQYQYLEPWTKLWRLRYYLAIPFESVDIYFCENLYSYCKEDLYIFSSCWNKALCKADNRMDWFYWFEDIKEDFVNE